MKTNEFVSGKEYQRRIFVGQCFNNACVMLGANLTEVSGALVVGIKDIFDYAEKLYDEGMKRDWLDYGNKKLEDKGTLKDPLTEKELKI